MSSIFSGALQRVGWKGAESSAAVGQESLRGDRPTTTTREVLYRYEEGGQMTSPRSSHDGGTNDDDSRPSEDDHRGWDTEDEGARDDEGGVIRGRYPIGCGSNSSLARETDQQYSQISGKSAAHDQATGGVEGMLYEAVSTEQKEGDTVVGKPLEPMAMDEGSGEQERGSCVRQTWMACFGCGGSEQTQ